MENDIRKEHKDLSKPFFNTWVEGKWLCWESNSPNNTIGDWVFEYDLDGSREKAWEEHLKKLEEEGILGNLQYRTGKMLYHPELDDLQESRTPLMSAKFIIFDISKDDDVAL